MFRAIRYDVEFMEVPVFQVGQVFFNLLVLIFGWNSARDLRTIHFLILQETCYHLSVHMLFRD